MDGALVSGPAGDLVGGGADKVDAIPLRLATLADVAEVCRLLVFLHAEVPFAPLDAGRLEGAVVEVVETGCALLSLAADGRIAGTMGLVLDQPWFSRSWCVRDIWLYVHAAERRAPHARALLRGARAYASALAVPLVVTVAPEAARNLSRVRAKMRLYSSELGEPSGATWSVFPQGVRET